MYGEWWKSLGFVWWVILYRLAQECSTNWYVTCQLFTVVFYHQPEDHVHSHCFVCVGVSTLYFIECKLLVCSLRKGELQLLQSAIWMGFGLLGSHSALCNLCYVIHFSKLIPHKVYSEMHGPQICTRVLSRNCFCFCYRPWILKVTNSFVTWWWISSLH